MLTFIDNFLNKITMYRLVLYILAILASLGIIFSFIGILPYSGLMFIASSIFIITICFFFNIIFSRIFKAPTNIESVYITAFILILIVSPVQNWSDFFYWGFLFWVSILSMASKYIVAINKKHIFNPASLALVITAFTLGHSANWWIGTLVMLPFTAVGGFLIVRKIQRFDLVLTFILSALISIFLSREFNLNTDINLAKQIILYSPIIFFSTIMLTEPSTTPPKKIGRIFYGAITGILFSPAIHIASVYSTPELSLLVGNIFSYLISPKERLVLRLKEKVKVAKNTYDFVFEPDQKIKFRPGQYLEWTLGHKNPDTRGNRRYFTIASSPTEGNIRLGVKFYPNGSTFKQNLLKMEGGGVSTASQLSGEFTLPNDVNKKLVFLAGGIGITPFRSIIKYLLDNGEKRNIVMLYSNRTPEDVAYRKILEEAQTKLGLKTVYTVTDANIPEATWQGKTGIIDEKMLKEAAFFGENLKLTGAGNGSPTKPRCLIKE